MFTDLIILHRKQNKTITYKIFEVIKSEGIVYKSILKEKQGNVLDFEHRKKKSTSHRL